MKRYIKSAKTIEDYENIGVFDVGQMYEIREGLEKGIDVSVYADPKYGVAQMGEIRKGLESGVDVSVYADPEYNWWQMNQIREGLESGVDVSWYSDPKYDGEQMFQIREGLEKGIDVSVYADPKYSDSQMTKIRKGLESGVDVSVYADPKESSSDDFSAILNELKSAGIDTTKYKYEMKAERYERYESGPIYTIKFTCPGDYLAYTAMAVHKSLTKDIIVNFFDEYYGVTVDNIDEMFDIVPASLDEMDDFANSNWWGDGDDYIIYLKNLTTGEYLCGPNEEEYEDEEVDEDW